MRTQTVEAKTKAEAKEKCEFGVAAMMRVESGKDGIKAWMCFESIDDYETAKNQN